MVCEASSFQLEDTEAFAPEAAVLLNLAEDHLDRHGTFDAYRAAKLEVFAHQPPDALAVAPTHLARRRSAAPRTGSTFGPGGDVEDRDGALCWRGEPLIRGAEIRLRGAAQPRERDGGRGRLPRPRPRRADAVRDGLATFARRRPPAGGGRRRRRRPVRQRLQGHQRRLRRGRHRSFPGGVHLILGGRGKGGDYAPLAAAVAERAGAVYLIGETAAELRDALAGTGVPLHDCGDLERAVAAARAAARARRRRPALAGLRVLRPVPLLRGARRPLPGARRKALA